MSQVKKVDYEVNPEKRYPTYKTESGWNFKGIQATLDKPHGLQATMMQIIREVQKGDKRFAPLAQKLSHNYAYTDILKAIDILVIDGILQTKSKNKKPNKSDLEWELQILSLDPRAQEQRAKKGKSPAEQYQKLKNLVYEKIENVTYSPLKSHLYRCLDQGELTSPSGEKVCGPEAWIKFQSITLTLAHSIVLLAEDKREPLRMISERIWGKSKILDRYKKDITCAAGQTLSQLNLTSMPEVTFVHGDVTYIYHGYCSSFLAGNPYSLTEETIKGLEIEQVGADKIFIIENLAVFQEVLMRVYHERNDVLLFWGAGYLSSPKMTLLQKVLQHKPIPVYIWSDLDADGLGLTLDIIKRVRKYKINTQPVLMSAEELDFAKGEYIAANHHNLDDPELMRIFPDVIERIQSQNVMEQEELLLHFEYLKNKLP